MTIDLGLNDPAAVQTLTWAIRIIDGSVSRLRDEVGSNPPSDDTEVYRLAQALPAGPITFDHTVFAAATAAREALEQVSYILRNEIPTSAIALQALIRSALVGAGRTTFALLPADPSQRLQNARVLVAQESNSYMRALKEYANFEKLLLMRPTEQDRTTAQTQNDALHDGERLRGDGAVMTGAAEVIGAALTAIPDYPNENPKLQREHVIWVWNAYSGLAHTYSWPRLMPSSGRDRRVPGDFPGDVFMVANTAHIAMLSLQSRLQPGSANTTASVPMRSGRPSRCSDSTEIALFSPLRTLLAHVRNWPGLVHRLCSSPKHASRFSLSETGFRYFVSGRRAGSLSRPGVRVGSHIGSSDR